MRGDSRVVFEAHGDDAGPLIDVIAGCAPALILAFVDPKRDREQLFGALVEAFPDTPTIGVTVEHQLGPSGWTSGAITGLALGRRDVRVGVGLGPDIDEQPFAAARAAVTAAAHQLDLEPHQLHARRHALITLFEPLAPAVETFCMAAATAAPNLHAVGSATSPLDSPGGLYLGAEALQRTGLAIVVETAIPMGQVTSHHLRSTGRRMVVTGVDRSRRIIRELDGFPAVEAYRAALAAVRGQPVTDVGAIAAAYPFARMVGGAPLMRSVVEVTREGLVMAASVDLGAVLALMQAGDLVATTAEDLARHDVQLGGISCGIAFSCLSRQHEALRDDRLGALGQAMHGYHLVGGSSGGEQTGGSFVNHTLAALLWGGRDGGS